MNFIRKILEKQPANPEVTNQNLQSTTDKKSIDPDNRPVYEMPSQTSEQKPEEQKCQLSKRSKIILGVSIAIVVIGLALGLGLGLTLTKTQVETGQINVIEGIDGSKTIISNLQIKEVSRWRPRIPKRLDFGFGGFLAVSIPMPETSEGRNLQEVNNDPDHTVVADLNDMGVVITVSPTDATTIAIEPDTLFNYIESQIPNNQRVLAETQDTQVTIDEIKEELGQVIRQNFDVQSTVHFKEASFETWVQNQTTGNFQLEDQTAAQAQRMLRERKWGRKSWNKAKKEVIPKVVAKSKQVVQEIKDKKNEIAAAVETIKSGVKQIAKPVKPKPKIPLAKPSLEKCLPKGSRKMRCRKNKDEKKKETDKSKVIQAKI